MLPDVIACPVCHTAPISDRCPSCGRGYPDGDYTPIPPPDKDVRSRWGIWETLQANGAAVYADDPAGNLSIGDRSDAQAFGEFSQIAGRVLDVGCGPQELPSYSGGEFFGIDPLAGGPRSFAFVQGIAEYLPFRDASFDRVLFATSLDHMLSPRRAIAEARRVLTQDGRLCIWHGEPPLPAPKPLRDRVRERFLGRPRILGYDTPRGAVDPFHFSHPRLTTVLEWLADGGLIVEDDYRDAIGNCYIKAKARD